MSPIVINDLWYKNADHLLPACRHVPRTRRETGSATSRACRAGSTYIQGLGATAIWLMPFQTFAGPRRRLRHRRLLQRRSAIRLASAISSSSRTAANSAGCGSSSTSSSTTPRTSIPGSSRRATTPKSPYRDWYVWSKSATGRTPTSGVVFPGVQKSTWTRNRGRQGLLLPPILRLSAGPQHRQPARVAGGNSQDHGLLAPARRVSGFRMDAVPFVIAQEGHRRVAARSRSTTCCGPVPRVSAMAERRRHHPRRGERPAEDRHGIFRRRRRTAADDVQLPGQSSALFYALATADKATAWRRRCWRPRPRPATAQWGTFLRNHDELDLGRLTEKQRQAVFAAFGPDKDMQLYGRGIRRRLAPMLQRRPAAGSNSPTA